MRPPKLCVLVELEGLGRVAVDVAPELVEQQDQRQPAARLVAPVIEFALRRPVDIVGELVANFLVKGGIFAEPRIHAVVDLRCAERLFLEPERENRLDTKLVVVRNRTGPGFAQEFYRHADLCWSHESANHVTKMRHADHL